MRRPVEFHPKVGDEVQHAHDWYEQQRSGLGGDFLDEVQQALTEIADNPGLHGLVDRDIRAATLTRFPYVVYYRVLVDRIRVLAVYHGSRDPSGWQSRS